MEGIEIGPAREGDLPAIAAFVMELGDEVGGPRTTNSGTIEENARALHHDPRSHLLVARQGEAIAGAVSYGTRRTLLHASESALIDELVVARPFRGQGIGGRLVAAVVDHCRRLGCCEVEVSTLTANGPARAFYRKCGFGEEAVLLEMDLAAE